MELNTIGSVASICGLVFAVLAFWYEHKDKKEEHAYCRKRVLGRVVLADYINKHRGQPFRAFRIFSLARFMSVCQ